MKSLIKSQYSYLFVSYIPKDLSNHFGGKIKFRVSLKSVIFSESQRLSHSLRIVMERIYDEIRRDMKSTLTIEDVKDILRKEIKRSQTHSNYFSYLGVHRRNDTSVGEGIRTLQYEEDKLNNRNKSDYDSEVKKILLREGFKIEKDNLYFKRLFRQLKENLIEVKYRTIKWKRDILLGQKKSEWDLVDDLMEELKDEIVQGVIKSVSSSKVELESPMLSETVQGFLDIRRKMNVVEKTISEYGYYLNEMLEIIEDKPIQEITHQDGRHYVDVLSQLPTNREKHKKFRGKSIQEVLKMKGVVPQKSQNVNKKLSRTSTFWRWVGQQYPDFVKDEIFKGKQIPTSIKGNKKEERSPFTLDEISKIFDPHTYLFFTVQMKLGGKETEYHYHSVRKFHLPYYWIPLIGLFTGMRINEICQLRIDDVYKDGKHYVFNIIESEDTKLKTNSSERIIPVHPILIKLGFHDYVKTLKELGKGRIFWELSKKRDGYSSKVSDWFNGKYLKSIGVHVPRKKVFHSFRHTMSGLLQKNGVRKEVLEGFLGHSHRSMSLDRYGDRFSTEVLWKEVINKISFDGVKWGDLKIDWKQRIHPLLSSELIDDSENSNQDFDEPPFPEGF